MVTPNPFVYAVASTAGGGNDKKGASRAPERATPLGDEVVAVNGERKPVAMLGRW
jgi:hypothetical protein